MKLPSTTTLLEIISGRRKGIVANCARLGLGMLTPFYRAGVGWRNRGFDRGRGVVSVEVPVISIGNMTTGGTGKTPMVIFVARYLREKGLRVALVSRGYGRDQNAGDARLGSANDEALELEHRLPDVPHLQDPDRARIAAVAVEELESQVILMDDGFQHRRLERDLDIVLIDATLPFGYGRLLPRGLLREPLKNLARADAMIITRADAVSDSDRSALDEQLQRLNPKAVIASCKTVLAGWMQFDETVSGSGPARGGNVFAFCAIGNPAGLRHSLQQAGVKLSGFKTFPDHHIYTREELDQIAREARDSDAQAIVCTHKDLVKVGVNRIAGIPVYALMIETEFMTGQRELASLIDEAVG